MLSQDRLRRSLARSLPLWVAVLCPLRIAVSAASMDRARARRKIKPTNRNFMGKITLNLPIIVAK